MTSTKIIEKEFIPHFFKDHPRGRFLEIGANDGEPGGPNEPVWPLVEMGWAGVYCEPNPNACSKLLTNIKPYKDILVVNGAVTTTRGLKQFYMSDEYPMAASLDPTWMPKMPYVAAGTNQYSIITNTFTMQDLVDHVGTNFDCISIDIENDVNVYNDLINSFDWRLFDKCKVFVIEMCEDEIRDYFISIGYTCLGRSEYNTIFVR